MVIHKLGTYINTSALRLLALRGLRTLRVPVGIKETVDCFLLTLY